MSHHKLTLLGKLGTTVRIYMDGTHAGDMVELWRCLRDFTVALEKEIAPKMKALAPVVAEGELIADKKPGEVAGGGE